MGAAVEADDAGIEAAAEEDMISFVVPFEVVLGGPRIIEKVETARSYGYRYMNEWMVEAEKGREGM